jgi:hypothetical protein
LTPSAHFRQRPPAVSTKRRGVFLIGLPVHPFSRAHQAQARNECCMISFPYTFRPPKIIRRETLFRQMPTARSAARRRQRLNKTYVMDWTPRNCSFTD